MNKLIEVSIQNRMLRIGPQGIMDGKVLKTAGYLNRW
jgi:hypothetical protein